MKRCLWLAVLLALAGPAQAQDPAPQSSPAPAAEPAEARSESAASADAAASPLVPPMTDPQLLERIMSRNPTLLAAQEAVEAARAEQKGMEGMLWPMISVNGQATAGTAERMSMPVPGIEPGNMSMRPRGLTANLNITAMYPLFTGGKFQAQIEGAKRRVEQAEAELAARRLELRAEAELSLLNLRWQRAQAELLQLDFERQAADLALEEERLRLGKVARYIVLRSRSELARLQQDINLVHLEIHQQQADLRRMAALPGDAPLAEPLALKLPGALTPLLSAAEAERIALDRSPRLAVLRAQLAEADTRVQIAKANYWPFVYLAGVYEQRIPEMAEMNYTSGGAIDLLVALPVFDGFRRDNELERIERDASRLLNEYTDARNRLQTEAGKSLLELEAMRVNLELAQAAVEQFEEEYKIVRLRYTSGKAILLELLDTANQWREARLNQLEFWYRHESARLGFERTLAIESPVTGTDSNTIMR